MASISHKENNETEEKQSVPTLLGLGILMRKPSRASETAKRQRQISFIFIPASVKLASAKKTPAVHKELQKICDWIRMFA